MQASASTIPKLLFSILSFIKLISPKARNNISRIIPVGVIWCVFSIVYSLDVLNATARIQGLCNFYKVDILISEDLIKALQLSSQFQIKSLGENELRGRDEKIGLFTII